MTNQFNTIEEALEDFKSGKPIIVADDEDRENEGDLISRACELHHKRVPWNCLSGYFTRNSTPA